MKRSKLSMLGAGFAMALAGLMGSAQAGQPTLVTSQNVNDFKGVRETKRETKNIEINNTGGLDFPPIYLPEPGLTPMQYGLRYGTGASRKGKSNRLRLSHNAKVGRR